MSICAFVSLITILLSAAGVRCCCPVWDMIQQDDLCKQDKLLSLSLSNNQALTCDQSIDASSLPAGPLRVTYPDADRDKEYLLIMVDPDAPFPDKPTCRYYLHWMVDNIKGDDLLAGNINNGNTITDFYPPSPPTTSPFHRYQLLVLTSPGGNITPIGDRCGFDLQSFLSNYSLCDSPVAVFQFKSGFTTA